MGIGITGYVMHHTFGDEMTSITMEKIVTKYKKKVSTQKENMMLFVCAMNRVVDEKRILRESL